MTLTHDPDADGGGVPADDLRVSVVIPCLDESASISECVQAAFASLRKRGVPGEVIVVDNGSVDGSGELAAEAGARVVLEPRRGYGAALRTGFRAATAPFVIMADADGSYDFGQLGLFVDQLEGGADLVVGDRMGNIAPGAMPWLHRYVGNPALSGLLTAMYKTGVRDAHCGMRGFRRDALARLDLRSDGMELASEMVVRAGKAGLVIGQVPITYSPRVGTSKLARFRDGWRHLRLLLVHAPLYLFVLPGATMAGLGSLLMVTVLFRVELLGRDWHLHTMVGGSLLVIAGAQVVSLGLCAHAVGSYFMGERSLWFERARSRLHLEHGLLLGGLLLAIGVVMGGSIVALWARRGLGGLAEERLAVLASTFVVVGMQVVFSAFLLSIIGRPRR